MSRPVALIHGMASTFENNWADYGWPDLLADEGRSVIPIELPGHGKSPHPPGTDVAAIIETAAEQAGGIDAVGFSAGSHGLLVAATRRPELFGAVALLGIGDGVLADNQTPDQDWRPAMREGLLGAEPPVGEGSAMVRLLRQMAATAGNDITQVAAQIGSDQPHASIADLKKITARVLLVVGTEDASGPADTLLAETPNCERVVLRGVDHFAIPGDFGCIDAVVKFLQG